MPSPAATVIEVLAALVLAVRSLATPDGRAAIRALRAARRVAVLGADR